MPIKHCRELEAYVRETAAVIPTLQKMGIESSLWHQHLLMAVDAGYGRSEFLAALARLYKAFGLVPGELDKKAVREYILLPKGQEQAADGYRVTWETVLEAAQEMNRSKISVEMTTVLGIETKIPSYLLRIRAAFISRAMNARPLPFPPRDPSPILEKNRVSS